VNIKQATISRTQIDTAFDTQMRSVGIVVMFADANGNVTSNMQDWLTDLLLSSPLLHRAVQDNMQHWLKQDSPVCIEACAGVWVAPVRQIKNKRTNGFGLGVFITDELCEGEYFHALCQASNADVTMIRELIKSMNPISTNDVNRMSTLFQMAWSTSLQNESTQHTVESVGKELADSYEEISLLYTITSSMNSVNHPERFIELACNELLQTLPYGWVGVQLRIGDRLPRIGNDLVFAGNAPKNIASAVRSITNDIESSPIISTCNDSVANRLGKATIIEPIINDGEVIGVLVAAEKQSNDPDASSVDIKLLSATAAQLAIFLENALLYEDLNATFLGTLEALTNSIDAKDKYTCGHSQRVALLTAQLAESAGLEADQVDRFRIAGLVHDIGKIGVPESVLLKKGDLTDDEFESIKKHPEIGARILKDIPQMEDILGGVLHHHEKFDGGGYPNGIAGDCIPLVARMISLADTFDAMSSSRTYRTAMTRNSVLNEMRSVVGTQFDPELAELFFDLDFSNWEKLMVEHQTGNTENPSAIRKAA
jgi:HD-GYP domain-containing protein (c-di-GMP phosphodiesterase class II)